MQHSSRRNPCPICERDKDDKCRWNDEFILCYVGNSFSPPGHLRIGDKIKVGQISYALCSQSSGFAGNSYCFALTNDIDYRFLCYEDKIVYRRQCVKVTRTYLAKYSAITKVIQSTRNQDEFCEMTADQFYLNKDAVKYAGLLLGELVEYATANKRHIVDYLAQLKTILDARKDVRTALNSIYDFERDFLASPNPEQDDMRGLQRPRQGAVVADLVSSHAEAVQDGPSGSQAPSEDAFLF